MHYFFFNSLEKLLKGIESKNSNSGFCLTDHEDIQTRKMYSKPQRSPTSAQTHLQRTGLGVSLSGMLKGLARWDFAATPSFCKRKTLVASTTVLFALLVLQVFRSKRWMGKGTMKYTDTYTLSHTGDRTLLIPRH